MSPPNFLLFDPFLSSHPPKLPPSLFSSPPNCQDSWLLPWMGGTAHTSLLPVTGHASSSHHRHQSIIVVIIIIIHHHCQQHHRHWWHHCCCHPWRLHFVPTSINVPVSVFVDIVSVVILTAALPFPLSLFLLLMMTSTLLQSSSQSSLLVSSFYLLCSFVANPKSFLPPLRPIIVDGIGRDIFAIITIVCSIRLVVIIQLIVMFIGAIASGIAVVILTAIAMDRHSCHCCRCWRCSFIVDGDRNIRHRCIPHVIIIHIIS